MAARLGIARQVGGLRGGGIGQDDGLGLEEWYTTLCERHPNLVLQQRAPPSLLAEEQYVRQHAFMRKFVIKILVNAVGLYVASLVVKSGISLKGTGAQLAATVLIVALVFGLVNTFIRPVVKLVSCGVLLLTLGLFTFVINALMLLLTSKISEHFAVQFYVKNFGSALLGSAVVTAVSLVLHPLLPKTRTDDDRYTPPGHGGDPATNF